MGLEVKPDGIFQGARAAMGSAPDLLLRQLGEPALDLVDPGRVGGREVKVEPRVTSQPSMDQKALVVEDQVDLEVVWTSLSIRSRKLRNSMAR